MGERLDTMLNEPALFQERGSCQPPRTPSVGEGSGVLEIRWAGRSAIMEAPGASPGPSDALYAVLVEAARDLPKKSIYNLDAAD